MIRDSDLPDEFFSTMVAVWLQHSLTGVVKHEMEILFRPHFFIHMPDAHNSP